MSTYRIYMRAADYSRLGELDTFQQFSCVQRFNDVGTWSLTCPYTARNGRLIVDGGGVILTRDNAVVFSGPINTIKRTASGFDVSGFDDMVILADNPAYPTPSETGPTFSDEADVRTGIPSTLILGYVEDNIGASAVAGTYLSQLTLAADPYLGTTVTARARFVTLLELCQEIAWSPQGGGLRFSIVQNDIASGGLLLTVSQPLDRRTSIHINRERGTLGAFTTSYKAPAATHVVVLGQGVGVDRELATATDAAAEELLGRRITRVYDRRDIEDSGELQDAADAALLNASAQRSVQIEPLSTSAVVWGRDYDLGDMVTVSAGDLVMDEVVRGVELTLTAPGGVATVQPIISSPQGGDSDDPDGIAARQFTALDQRVSNVERNVRAPLAGSLTGSMLASGAAVANIGAGTITGTMLAASAKWNAGDIRMTGRSSAATGWLLCDGSVVSRTTYAALFTAISTTFNTGGEAGTDFRLPDMRQRFPLGADSSYTLGQRGGAATVDLSHDHGGLTGNSTAINNDMGAGLNPRNAANHEHPIDNDLSSSQDIRNPYLAVNFEIYTGA